ncbi:MAG: hydroxymethylbilane synthase [Candidatus Syntrophonatronum acetioxidans]|uniref:Porphobilinogen deaminase n=1 Tax=Candidatus Syntrophonatronum acetioxidans TaxID=1795816 RepID=A0A424YEB2_9FIRM|nr:MAG: hydroxymethylbilane synthase [Candidatus Syntrophonatronum acetioxidans]
MKTLVIGTRGSQLALAQARFVLESLKQIYPHLSFEVKIIKTTGDKFLNQSFDKMEGKGFFVKEIEDALLNKEIDLAVHSMKDLPTEEEKRLKIVAVTEREDPRDVLVSREDYWLVTLPRGAVIGTSSVRRKAQLLYYRPDLKFKPVRGNINTRLRKMGESQVDAIILAYSGLKRLSLEKEIREILPMEMCMPAAGQGALGIQVRTDDENASSIARSLNHYPTERAIAAERAMLKYLGGGCHVPIGAYGELKSTEVRLWGVVASTDGRFCLRDVLSGPISDAAFIGRHLARRLLKKGAEKYMGTNHSEC